MLNKPSKNLQCNSCYCIFISFMCYFFFYHRNVIVISFSSLGCKGCGIIAGGEVLVEDLVLLKIYNLDIILGLNFLLKYIAKVGDCHLKTVGSKGVRSEH